MSPKIAAIICILVIFYLFSSDSNKADGVSRAIWIPTIWMFLAGSRYVSQWFNIGPAAGSDFYLDGNPVDRVIFSVLMFAGVVVLSLRNIKWRELFSKNIWICLFLGFCIISILWSDYPYVAFKRFIKALGNAIMALIILSERYPYEAVRIIVTRIAFIMLPLSVLFIKYFPDLGRSYHMGKPIMNGICHGKNGLGQICLLTGIIVLWDLLINRYICIKSLWSLNGSEYILLFLIFWLLHMSNSATSFTCLSFSLCIYAYSRQAAVIKEPRKALLFCIACAFLFGILELGFDAKETILTILGRRPDFTTRVPMWEDLLSMVRNPWIGFGYESFWLGARQQYMIERWSIALSAHNGYLETYLNLGLVGLSLLLCMFVSGIRKISRNLVINYSSGVLNLCFIVVLALYNITESTFYGVSNMWIVFYLATIDMLDNEKNDMTCYSMICK